MSPGHFTLTEGPYLRDILDQPTAVRATIEHLGNDVDLFRRIAAVRQQPHARVVLTGMGSSLYALYPLELALTAQGETVCRAETAELIHGLPGLLSPESVIVAVSQSGQSAETIRLLEQNHGRARIIGVTNTENSPLHRESDFCLLTRCGDEFSVSTKTYMASLVALEALAAAWGGLDFDPLLAELSTAPDSLAEYLASWRDHAQALASQLDEVRQYFILGRGRSLASCGTGALILKESTRTFAEGMSSAAFRHGPLEMVSPGSLVLVFDGDPGTRHLNRKLVHTIRERGGRAETIGSESELAALRLPGNPSRTLTLLEMAPVQMLTLAIAARSGIEAGCFQHAAKITTEE
jgi:glucosamine--fructose-6-phosphate aminotransferase (isomerizing)